MRGGASGVVVAAVPPVAADVVVTAPAVSVVVEAASFEPPHPRRMRAVTAKHNERDKRFIASYLLLELVAASGPPVSPEALRVDVSGAFALRSQKTIIVGARVGHGNCRVTPHEAL